MSSTESNLINSYKKMFNLSNVNNTSDSQKPINDLTQVALDTKLSLMGGILTGGLSGTTASFTELTGSTGTFNNDVQINGNLVSISETVVFSDVQFNGGLTGTSGTFTGMVNLNSNINVTNGTFSNGLTSIGLSLTGGLTGTTATFTSVDRSNGEILIGGLTGTTGIFSGDIIANTTGNTGISMLNLSSQIQNLQDSVNYSTNLFNLPNYKSDLDAYNNELNVNKLYLKNGSINVIKNGFNSMYKFNWNSSNNQKYLRSSTYQNYTDLVNKSVTIESWVYPYWSTSGEIYMYIFDNRGLYNTSTGFALGIYKKTSQSYGVPFLFTTGYASNNGKENEGDNLIIPSNITIPPRLLNETWNHIAFIFNKIDKTVKVYLNGSECIYQVNAFNGTNFKTSTAWDGIGIGMNYQSHTYDRWGYFNGYIGGLRISNTILYTSTGFTPPTFFTKTSSTVFLLGPNFKELVNGNQITIYGSNGNDITVSSLMMSTTSSNYLIAYQMSSTNLLQMYGSFYELIRNSWTIECWIKTNAINTNNPIIISLNNNNSWFKIMMSDTGFITFNVPLSTAYLTGNISLVANKWTHIALTRNRTTIILYINGINCASSTIMPDLSNVIFDNISIGNAWNASGTEQTRTFDGLISQVHISKKVLYSSNFISQFGLYPSDISSTIFYLGNNYNDIITGKSLRIGNPLIVTF